MIWIITIKIPFNFFDYKVWLFFFVICHETFVSFLFFFKFIRETIPILAHSINDFFVCFEIFFIFYFISYIEDNLTLCVPHWKHVLIKDDLPSFLCWKLWGFFLFLKNFFNLRTNKFMSLSLYDSLTSSTLSARIYFFLIVVFIFSKPF